MQPRVMGRKSMMDADRCAAVLVGRCTLLVTYHFDPARPRGGGAGLAFELGWLAADARRWGVSDEALVSGVKAELDRRYDREAARRLFAGFIGAFRHATEASTVP